MTTTDHQTTTTALTDDEHFEQAIARRDAILARPDVAAIVEQARTFTPEQRTALHEEWIANFDLHRRAQLNLFHRYRAAVGAPHWRDLLTAAEHVESIARDGLGVYESDAWGAAIVFGDAVKAAVMGLSASEAVVYLAPWRTVFGDADPIGRGQNHDECEPYAMSYHGTHVNVMCQHGTVRETIPAAEFTPAREDQLRTSLTVVSNPREAIERAAAKADRIAEKFAGRWIAETIRQGNPIKPTNANLTRVFADCVKPPKTDLYDRIRDAITEQVAELSQLAAPAHVPAGLDKATHKRWTDIARKVDDANTATLREKTEHPAPRGDAAVDSVKAARKLVDLAIEHGLVVAVVHRLANNDAPYFMVQAVNPHREIERYEVTWHTFKGRDGGYGLMHSDRYDDSGRRVKASLKAISDQIASTATRAAEREAAAKAQADADADAADPRTPREVDTADLREGQWRWNTVTGWEHILWIVTRPSDGSRLLYGGRSRETLLGTLSARQKHWVADAQPDTPPPGHQASMREQQTAAETTPATEPAPEPEPQLPDVEELSDPQNKALVTIANARAAHAAREDANRTPAPTLRQMGITKTSVVEALGRSGHIERIWLMMGDTARVTDKGHLHIAMQTADTARLNLVIRRAQITARRAQLAAENRELASRDDQTYARRLRQLNDEEDRQLYAEEMTAARTLEAMPVTAAGSEATPEQAPVEAAPITVVQKRKMSTQGQTRYDLSNGWFINRDEVTHHRAVRDQKYSAWAPGGAEGGSAALIGTANSLSGLIANLNAGRVAAPAEPVDEPKGDEPEGDEPTGWGALASALGGAA